MIVKLGWYRGSRLRKMIADADVCWAFISTKNGGRIDLLIDRNELLADIGQDDDIALYCEIDEHNFLYLHSGEIKNG